MTNDRDDSGLEALVARLKDAVLTGRSGCATSNQLRRAVQERALARSLGKSGQSDSLDASQVEYVDAVALAPLTAPVEKLLQQGSSEDAVFELTIAAALGAGMARLEQGLLALRGKQ